ncbi:hypothetical protein HII31_02555 [Pseudocercospora fuligena]|uniref:BTB domain-containing protein n=1 Tax=Pseudocercospora fuligena TaxID=685502 RepID=A0A8H6VPW1_9PEZI|nr:hypothetical protein HII31_02555 [Pseudocercospora fuligena]
MADTNDPLVVKNSNFIQGGFAVVLVGRDKKRCFVHKSLLQRRALDIGIHKGPAIDEYHIVNTNKDTFELYVHHLYTNEIQCKVSNTTEHWDIDDQDFALVELYGLARFLGDDITKHAVLRAFIEEAKRSHKLGKGIAPSYRAIDYIYDEEESNLQEPLVRLFIDMCIWDKTIDDDFYEMLKDSGFGRDVRKVACDKLRRGDAKSVIDKTCCDYHQLKNG